MSCIWPIFQFTTQNLLWGLKNNERCHSILNQLTLWPSNQSCSRFENISTKWSWLHQRCPPKNLPLEPILTNCSTLVRKAREEHLGVFLQAYHFLFAMYSNLVSVSVIIFFFFSHSYSATTRTRHGRRLSNHNVFLKTLKVFCKRTNNIHKFEGEHSGKLS